MTKEVSGKKIVVLPIVIEQCEVPIFLQDKLYADFTDPWKYETEFRKIIDAISGSAQSAPATPTHISQSSSSPVSFSDDSWLSDARSSGLQSLQRANRSVPAFWEVIHYPYFRLTQSNWDNQKLVNAVQETEKSIDWPLAHISGGHDARKFGISSQTGMEVKIPDFWELHHEGQFFFVRALEESILTYNGQTQTEKVIYFDTRIKRTAEALLHCKTLYKALALHPEQTIHFMVNYYGLSGRVLKSGEPGRHLSLNYQCVELNHQFTKVCSIEQIENDFKTIVYEMTKSLFDLFKFYSYQKQVCDDLVDSVLNAR